ncbi:MAG TPA: pitrilysin family protein [Candidatus Cybelea sp.]|nr:pitrilysin family protein [Candidatus Cybelea sp.]
MNTIKKITAHTIEVTTLPNGLRVASDRMDSVETVSVGIWAGVGTRHETAAENGVAHLLEHMAFKGTRRRSARAIAEEIESVGGLLNAYTGREQTAYYAKMLAPDLPLAVDVLGDILQDSIYDPEELERERAVVLQEIGQAEDTPDDIIFDHFQEVAFPDQPMGWPVLGRAEIIETAKRETVAGYLASRYRPDRMIVAAAGNIEHDRLVELATATLDRLPAGTSPEAHGADYRGGEHREDRELEQVNVVLGFPGVSYHDPDYYVAAVLSQLLGGGMSSRLFQEVREKRGLVYSIHSFSSSYSDCGLFGVYAGTGESEAAEMMPVICDEILKVGDSLAEAEVARAAAQLKAGTLMSRESTSSRCEQLASQLLLYGRPIPPEEAVTRIEAVTPADVMRLARRIFGSSPTLASLGPVAKVPSLDAVRRRLA